jgi:hypothetical protein
VCSGSGDGLPTEPSHRDREDDRGGGGTQDGQDGQDGQDCRNAPEEGEF